MQPRFAALLFVLGLADLAYVNLGLGHDVFGDAASGATSTAPSAAPPSAALIASPPAPTQPAPSAAPIPSPPAPTEPAPAPTPSTPPAPTPEAVALPEPTPQVEPSGEPAPSVEPAPAEGAPGKAAPSADALPGSPRPAQAGAPSAGTRPLRDSDPLRDGEPPADSEPAPVASAASLPDAELTVPFHDTASAGLSDEARAQLLELAAQLRAHPDYRIHIVGHADARGTREFNLDLGSRRARAVTELLARAGVAREQLEVESRGEDQPKVFGNSEQTWAANRRVEISIGIERSTAP